MRVCYWLLLLLLLLGVPGAGRAQTPPPPADPQPAWRRELAAAHTDSARGRLYYWLSSYAVTIDSERCFAQRSITYSQRALRTARGHARQQVLVSLAGAFHALGTASASAGDRPTAIRYLQQAIQLEQQTGDSLTLTLSLSNLGGVYTNERRYLLALQTLQRSISLAERVPGASRKLSVYLSRMGRLQEFLGNDSAALRYHLRAVGRLRHPTDLNDWDDLVLCLGNLSDTYLNAFDDTTRAERSMRQARALVGQSAALSYRLAEVLFRQGAIRRREGRWVAARALLLAAQARARATNNQLTLARIQANLALVEENTGHLPLALRYALQSVSYGQRNLLADESLAADIVARLYEKLGRPREALAALHRAQVLRDSTSNDADKRRALGQLLRADYQRRTQALRAAQAAAAAELRRQRRLLWGLLAGAGLLGLLAASQWRSHRRQQQATRREQQANALLAAQKTQLEEQATRLGELDEAKNQFFANVSHELRTPLTLILGPLDGLLTAPPRPLPPAVRQPVALAYRHAQRLRELVNRILDLTRLQAGRLGLHPVPTDVAALLCRVVGQFGSLAAERGIALAGPAGLPPALPRLLDADKVEQVLTNLLINALNHTPAGGRVTVAAELPAPDGQCAVRVQDTGPGIAPAEQARVFERYYQSPQGPVQGGTGLGLALSHELAQLLGGTLTLASPPGQGATFTFCFPAEAVALQAASGGVGVGAPEAEAEPAPPAARFFSPGSRPRVLVVEDQPDLRDYLRQLLAPTCEVLTAADGQAALDLLATGPPLDLVATDAMMPRLSGTELLARLRADPARAGVPVLMLTARADDAHRLHALAIGVDDYLTKPFVPAELLARVRALLRHHAARRHYAALPPDPDPDPTAEETGAAGAAAKAPAGAPAGPAPGPAAAEQLAHWQARVADRLADPAFGPDELADELLLSRRTLYRRLGELAGLTPAAWLRELRLAYARRLLEAGHFQSVADVAEAAGFANAKYFGTLYTERFGRRPSDYGS